MNNFMMSDNWSFYELTATNNGALRVQNRIEARIYLDTGRVLSRQLLQYIRAGRPLYTGSGFRGEALNSVTKGSSSRSQHRLFQAADVCRPKEDCSDVFDEIIDILLSEQIPFGQCIKEEVTRDYGISRWIHISLGPGYRDPGRCGEILTRKESVWKLEKKVDCLGWKLPKPWEAPE